MHGCWVDGWVCMYMMFGWESAWAVVYTWMDDVCRDVRHV